MSRHDAVRITTAPASRADDLATRQRRYFFSMAIRTACFVGAVATDGVIRWVLMFGALVLPYVAVVIANAGDTRQDAFELPDTDYRRELGPGEQRDEHGQAPDDEA
jgi:hypothetical protein